MRVNWLIITFTENKFRPENLTLLFCFFSYIKLHGGPDFKSDGQMFYPVLSNERVQKTNQWYKCTHS